MQEIATYLCLLISASTVDFAISTSESQKEDVAQCLGILAKQLEYYAEREIDYVATFKRSSQLSNVEFDAFEPTNWQFDSNALLDGKVALWNSVCLQTETSRDLKTNDLNYIFGYYFFDGREVSVDFAKNRESITVDNQPMIFGNAFVTPFFGIFNLGNYQKLQQGFRVWPALKNWSRVVVDDGLVLGASTSDQRVKLTFLGKTGTGFKLSRVELVGSTKTGVEKTSYRIVADYDYEPLDGAGSPEFPTSVKQLSVDKTASSPLIYGTQIECKLKKIGYKKPPFEKLGEVIELPNGTTVDIIDHRGIEFEWKDGEVVRVIDRKKLEGIRRIRFKGAKWLIPILVVMSICVGLWLRWLWVKR
jgi:hypothetical protein